MTKSIFVTNNGLLDHIGVAQVAPYLNGLACKGHQLKVVSVEQEPDSLESFNNEVSALFPSFGIQHFPVFLSGGISRVLTRFINPWRIKRKLTRLVLSEQPEVIHCRSYMPLKTVLDVTRTLGIPFVFDMRGFWIDQRVEGGQWKSGSLFWKMVEVYFRRIEREAISRASVIVTLTNDAREVILKHPSYSGAKVVTIPCSVDQEAFRFDEGKRVEARKKIGVNKKDFVLTFLGGGSSLYRKDVAFRLFQKLKSRGVSPKLLFIGTHDPELLIEEALQVSVDLELDDLICLKVPHAEVPDLLCASDVGLSLIIQSFSSKGVSATKVGEYLSCGLPVIANEGVGDIKSIITGRENGFVLSDFSDESIDECASLMAQGGFWDRSLVRESARKYFNLDEAISKYDEIYNDFASSERA
ncbi:glycosyltransferase [Alcanivorax sp. S6407]|uniref:glycosyltransferase n=1 Tax=Alcanivorax sp. S6407 TaxID=2926424 RepID=UPI001FF50356|nr:glycosyltransferase [Alcanivorax sp. S6407]MCK0152836.1 glycosyltransferase [Alcanivorax sp. S6407]